MPIRYPQKSDLIRFVYQINVVEGLKVAKADIDDIYRADRPKELNPFVIAAFDAINYGLKTLLNNNPDFPCKEISLITNRYRSYDAIAWLRELHSRLTSALVKASLGISEKWGQIDVTPGQCGAYRTEERPLAFSMAPPPSLIEALLHNWLVDISTFHDRIKDQLDNPYMNVKDAAQLVQKADDACLFISAVQPFAAANNRLAWLVNNLLRCLWRLPWRNLPGGGDNTDREYKQWIQELTSFQSQKLPTLLLKASATAKEFG